MNSNSQKAIGSCESFPEDFDETTNSFVKKEKHKKTLEAVVKDIQVGRNSDYVLKMKRTYLNKKNDVGLEKSLQTDFEKNIVNLRSKCFTQIKLNFAKKLNEESKEINLKEISLREHLSVSHIPKSQLSFNKKNYDEVSIKETGFVLPLAKTHESRVNIVRYTSIENNLRIQDNKANYSKTRIDNKVSESSLIREKGFRNSKLEFFDAKSIDEMFKTNNSISFSKSILQNLQTFKLSSSIRRRLLQDILKLSSKKTNTLCPNIPEKEMKSKTKNFFISKVVKEENHLEPVALKIEKKERLSNSKNKTYSIKGKITPLANKIFSQMRKEKDSVIERDLIGIKTRKNKENQIKETDLLSNSMTNKGTSRKKAYASNLSNVLSKESVIVEYKLNKKTNLGIKKSNEICLRRILK